MTGRERPASRPPSRRRSLTRAIAFGAAAWMLAGCTITGPASAGRDPKPPATTAGAGPAESTTLLGPVRRNTGCHLRDGVLPDSVCTPGAVLTHAGLAAICRPGFAASQRPPESYTEPIKRADMRAYGLAGHSLRNYVLDHLVPLELGGAGYARANLWIQTEHAGHEKDEVENALAADACAGRIPLRDAQQEIAHNWYALWLGLTPTERRRYTYRGDGD